MSVTGQLENYELIQTVAVYSAAGATQYMPIHLSFGPAMHP